MKNTTITFDLIMYRVYANHVIYYVHMICCVEQYTANYTIIVYIIICIYIFIPSKCYIHYYISTHTLKD